MRGSEDEFRGLEALYYAARICYEPPADQRLRILCLVASLRSGIVLPDADPLPESPSIKPLANSFLPPLRPLKRPKVDAVKGGGARAEPINPELLGKEYGEVVVYKGVENPDNSEEEVDVVCGDDTPPEVTVEMPIFNAMMTIGPSVSKMKDR